MKTHTLSKAEGRETKVDGAAPRAMRKQNAEGADKEGRLSKRPEPLSGSHAAGTALGKTPLLAVLLTLTAHAFEPDVVIDETDTAHVEFAGSWATDSTTTNAFRGTAKVSTSTAANSNEWARFHTTLPVSGPWKVFVWHNGRSGFGDDVNVEVTSAETAVSTATLGQHANAGQWFLVGTYWFENNAEAQVKIRHNDSGQLSADAVRFSFATPDVVLDTTGDSTGVALLNASGNISSASWPSMSSDLSTNEINIRRSTVVNARVEFSPVLPAAGDYDVSLWLPRRAGAWVSAGSTGATSVQVEIYARAGMTTHTVELPPDNGAHEGAWVRVGSAPFRMDATPASGTNPNKLVIKGPANSGICVPADAARWSKVGNFGIYQDDDPAGPPGVVLGTKQTGQTVNWSEQAGTGRTARRHQYYHYQPMGLRNMKADDNNQRATFTPALPELGLYDVYLWYPWGSGNAATTLVTTQTALGTVTKTVNQGGDTGKWAHVGRYILHPNITGQPAQSWLSIEPNNNPGSDTTKADAVLYLRDGEEADADADGLPDWHEQLLGTNTSGQDANNDGRADGWDTDSDGLSDYEEYKLGTNALAYTAQTTGSTLLTIQIPLK